MASHFISGFGPSVLVLGGKAKAIGELAGAMSENLMYYFLPALLIGIYCRFPVRDGLRHINKPPVTEIEKFFIPAFAALNIVMLIALFYKWSYISRRHCMPLVVFTIFYVPIGLQVLSDWFANRFFPASHPGDRRWFFILLIIGIIICLPKLLARPGSYKPGYRTAAVWLKQNTAPDDLITSTDRRITFYAERKPNVYETAPPGNAQKQYSVWVSKQKKKKIVIYKISS